MSANPDAERRVPMVHELERLSGLVEATSRQVRVLSDDVVAQRFERQEQLNSLRVEMRDSIGILRTELKDDIGKLFRNGPITAIQREIAAIKQHNSDRAESGAVSSEASAVRSEASAVRSDMSTFKTALICSLLAAVITLLGIGAKDMIDRANAAAARATSPTAQRVGP